MSHILCEGKKVIKNKILATVDTAGNTHADDREYNFQLVTSENRILRILFKRNETIGILKVKQL